MAGLWPEANIRHHSGNFPLFPRMETLVYQTKITSRQKWSDVPLL